jgi:rRNA maturation endonuclease Nob1
VKNPLRLTLLCLAWHIRQGDFTTKTQADLYAQFSEALYEWKRDKFPTTSQQRRELNKALATLALRGMAQDESRFRLRQGLVREVLGETDEPLCQLALQLGWINRVGVAVERPEEAVYAFYHPTFQEYFAALGVDDWHYFLNHVPGNPGLGNYRIFEKQWKQVILLWFGRENLAKEKKEEFVEALIRFNDGVNSFYWQRAYFLAGAVLSEFKDSRFADSIVSQIFKWGFGYFDARKDSWVTFLKAIEQGAREVLTETNRERAISGLIQLLDQTSNEFTRWSVAESLGKIAVGNDSAITRLIQLLDQTSDTDALRKISNSLSKIISTKQQYSQVFSALKLNLTDEIYQTKFYFYEISYQLILQCAQNLTYPEFYTAWQFNVNFMITCPACGYTNSEDSEFCDACGYDCSTNSIAASNTIICAACTYENPKGSDFCDACGYDCSKISIIVNNTIVCPACHYENLGCTEFCDACGNQLGVTLRNFPSSDPITCPICTYENQKENEFCDACGYEITLIVSDNVEYILDPLIQSLENQITNIFTQLQPTAQTYRLPINIQSLIDEIDTSTICQEICTQIYSLALPDADIPSANNFAQLKRHILTAKRQLQKPHLLLILHQCEPHPTLLTCCRKIADANLGLHIAWITDTPLDSPLRGFPPQQPHLVSALQTWINELS